MEPMTTTTDVVANSGKSPVVLCVDDEKSILTSLKRALRKEPFELLLANSGDEALDVMQQHAVDLVVSDMRMPNMDGAELLARVYAERPETLRILLTGYSDMESTVSAINKGQIFRYISKPWNNEDLISTINAALEHKRLRDEHKALTALTQKQNAELKDLNENLETKVKARTAEIAKATALLKSSFTKLKESYGHTISVFSHLIEFREGNASLHGEHVSQLCAKIGKEVDLSEKQLTDLHNASLLHDIGKLCFNDELSKTPYNALNEEQLKTYQSHSSTGQMALLSVAELADTGIIIRAHHEQYDGKGFPDGLAGDDIPITARILAIASDFDDLQNGIFLGKALSASDAVAHIKGQANKRYDPELVKIFERLCKDTPDQVQAQKELKISYNDMEPGMTVTKDIIAENGMLLLKKGQTLNESLIGRIQQCLRDTDSDKVVYVSNDTSRDS